MRNVFEPIFFATLLPAIATLIVYISLGMLRITPGWSAIVIFPLFFFVLFLILGIFMGHAHRGTFEDGHLYLISSLVLAGLVGVMFSGFEEAFIVLTPGAFGLFIGFGVTIHTKTNKRNAPTKQKYPR